MLAIKMILPVDHKGCCCLDHLFVAKSGQCVFILYAGRRPIGNEVFPELITEPGSVRPRDRMGWDGIGGWRAAASGIRYPPGSGCSSVNRLGVVETETAGDGMNWPRCGGKLDSCCHHRGVMEITIIKS